jgi:hypothetical protein
MVTVACRGPFARRSRTTPCPERESCDVLAVVPVTTPWEALHCCGSGEVGAQVGPRGDQGVEAVRAWCEPEGGREPVAQRYHRAGQVLHPEPQVPPWAVEMQEVNVLRGSPEKSLDVRVSKEPRVRRADEQAPEGDPRVGEELCGRQRGDGPSHNVGEEDAGRLPCLKAVDRLGCGEERRPGPGGEVRVLRPEVQGWQRATRRALSARARRCTP